MKSKPPSKKPANNALQSHLKRTCKKSTSYFPTKQKVIIARTRPIKIRTFKLFPKLPLEIRNQIWYHTLPGPRLLNLQIHLVNKPIIHGCRYLGDGDLVSISFNYKEIREPSELMNIESGYYDGMDGGPQPNEKAGVPLGPQALHVNRESREVALREGYGIAFAGEHGRPELKACKKWKSFGFAEKRIWINFLRDVLFLEDVLLVKRRWRYATEEMEKVKRMGFRLAFRAWKAGDYRLVRMKNFLRGLLVLKGLEELFIWDSTTEDNLETAGVDANSHTKELKIIQMEMEELWAELFEDPERSGRKVPKIRVTQVPAWI